MCGIVGCFDLLKANRVPAEFVFRMAAVLAHRGPDSFGYIQEPQFGLGSRRLSIVDRNGGGQPMFSSDGSVVMVCNGEIFNHRELRANLESRGYRFASQCDIEVLIPLYQQRGLNLLDEVNGQFSFILYDRRKDLILAARDHVGITPLFYTISNGYLLLASEIKALLQSGLVKRSVNLTGLDQVLALPGLVSPVTMFKGIHSLPGGHRLVVREGALVAEEYWDLDYPAHGQGGSPQREHEYVDQLNELLTKSIERRLQADVPVGLYLSGGLDSSLIGALSSQISEETPRHSFSVAFSEISLDESSFQQRVARHIKSVHHEVIADVSRIADRLTNVIYHCECPLKETYNSCSLLLAEMAEATGVKVVLSGEGADELFGGYVGYRLDIAGARKTHSFGGDLYELMEKQISEDVWGDAEFYYENDFQFIDEVRRAIYSEKLRESLKENGCFSEPLINKKRLAGRSIFHQRSYLDLKLRLSDHLLADHGDRMAMARGVETRYPFLDRNLIDWARAIPNDILFKNSEKYLLRQVARRVLPEEIALRPKFGFHAPGSSQILRLNREWMGDLLSYERIKRQGYFNPTTIEKLKKEYTSSDFRLNIPFENDLLTIVITFGIFLDVFEMPSLG